MFLTYSDPQQAAAQAEQIMAMRQAAQQLRVSEDWQPRLTRLLTALPAECLEALQRAAVARADRDTYEDVLDILHHFIANFDVAQGQALLEEMVRAEARALAEIISFHGLLGGTPDTAGWPARLAGDQALAESLERSWDEFRARVGRELDGAFAEAGGAPDPRQLAARLQRHASWWEGRLKTVAATLTQAAINRARQELGRTA